MKRRVVVTGLGALSSVGADVASMWQAMLAGKNGITRIEHFDVSDYACQFAGTVGDVDISQYVSPKDARRMDPFIQYGLFAAGQAVNDSGLENNEAIDGNRVGVAIGSGIGGLGFIEETTLRIAETGSRKVSPFFIPGSISNMVAGNVSIRYGFKGPNFAVTTACTTGTHCIGLAARMITYGDADVMVAGGAEKASCPAGLAGFAAAKALSTRNDDPAHACRPWDRDRDGFVLGDGAGVLVLEEYEHALRRKAPIYAELVGFGMSGDAYHITRSDGVGAQMAMELALADARLNPEAIDYVNAHATSTKVGDAQETISIHKTFGDHAKRLACSSTKSMIGHLLGATGAVEAICSVLAIRDQVAPPTINLDNPDEGCDLDYVPHHAREMKIDHALSNSFGFGGTNGCLIFARMQ